MARGCVIVKRGKNYSIVYYVNGKQKWKSIGPNKREAEQALIEIMRQVHRGEYQELKKISFADFAHKWLNDYAEGTVKPSTYSSYKHIIQTHLILYFGDFQLRNITPDIVQGYVSRKMRQGVLSPKTINNTLVPLKKMLKHAVRWGYLRQNPAQHVEKPRVEPVEMSFLTPGEVGLFLKEVNPDYYPLFLTAVLTGMRRGELLALKWDDVDWNSSTIFVRRSLYKGGFVTPKSKTSRRTIVISPRLRDVLLAHKINSSADKNNLLFCTSKGKPLEPDNLVKRQFLPALHRAGLRRIRFHDLRHTYTALLISQGENIKFIQNQLGHASIQTTLDRYGHLLPEANTQAAKRLDDTIFPVTRESQKVTSISKILAKRDFDKEKASVKKTNALLETGSGDRI